MRITTLLLTLFVFYSNAAEAFAQNARVSINKTNVRLDEILNEIEKQTDYLFVYNNQINSKERHSIKAKDKAVSEVLNDLLNNAGFSYTLEGKHIVLAKSAKKSLTSEAEIQQEKKNVTGIVLDKFGETIIGANVVIKGTTTGVITDIDGRFSLEVSEGEIIEISYIGYLSQEFLVGNQNEVKISLVEAALGLDELVVVGFGVQKKVNLTGAVSSVKMDKILGDRPVTSLGSALQGTIPGFTASSSPVPGGGNNWNIRGFGSITGGGPLVLVDNVVYTDLSLLNPADIESVSVLKDASAAAIYGARASFGVILITTKKSKKNETLTINYNNNFSLSKVSNLPELASPIDFINTLANGGYSSIWSGQNIESYQDLLTQYNNDPSIYPKGWTEVNGTKYFLQENDVQKEMFESSWKQTHNISAQGGSERIKYRLSLGQTSENGVLVTSKDAFKRTSIIGYVSSDITSWFETSLDISYNQGNKTYPFLDSSSELGIWKTNLPSYHPIGTLPYGNNGEDFTVMTPANVIRMTDVSRTITDNTRILSRSVLKPFDGFQAILEYSYQASFQDYESYANPFQVHQGLAESIKPSTSTTPFTQERRVTKYTTINAFGTYNKTYNDAHNLSLLAGFNQESSDYRFLHSQAYNMISSGLPSIGGTDGVTPSKTKDNYVQYALRSGFFRAAYNYNERYFIEMNGRHDLSSKFPKGYRAGFFPSFAAAWNIINEPFMEESHSFLSVLKLRSSYGILGNQNIGAYSYLPTMDIVNANWLYGNNIPKTLNAPDLVRANFTWENVKSINGGIDLGFFNNRINASFDIFRRNTIGMLGPSSDLPAVAGAPAPLQNAANLKTNGWEITLSWKDQVGQVNYGLDFNLYDSHSYITKYKNETGLLSSSHYTGKKIGEIWGYVTDGFYTADDFTETGALKEGVVQINGVTSHPGDIKYANLSDDDNSLNMIDTGDNTVDNPGDRQIIGNSEARFQYGLNGYANWKGFGLSFLLQGVGKRDAWIGGDITFPMMSQYSTVYEHQVGEIWTENNPDAFYGRIYENGGSSQGSNQRVSDKFLYNAAYLRVKNISLSYVVPNKYLQNIYLKNLKVFLSTENPFTFDHLPKGIDPSNLNWGYPHPRTISFGINFNL